MAVHDKDRVEHFPAPEPTLLQGRDSVLLIGSIDVLAVRDPIDRRGQGLAVTGLGQVPGFVEQRDGIANDTTDLGCTACPRLGSS